MSNKKVNRWIVKDGKIVEANNSNKDEGKPASEVVQGLADEAFDEMEQPIVDSLKAKDEGYIKSRRERMSKSIDKKRITNQIKMLNQEKEDFLEFLIEASQAVETQQKELEAQVIEVEKVEVKPFAELLAAKLGGALTSSTSAGELPEGNSRSAKNKLEGLM